MSYDHSVEIRGKKINFRKWKVKDRNKFKDAKIEALEGEQDFHSYENALVFDCLEDPNVALTPEEFRYILAQIRKISIGNSLHYEFQCKECQNDYELDMNIDELYTISYKDFGTITGTGISFKMGKIQNQNYYKEDISSFSEGYERELFDFMMHIHEVNGSQDFDFDGVFNLINELDIDVANEIFSQWNEMKFNINDEHEIKCPFCENIENIKFDFLPNFLPDDWY